MSSRVLTDGRLRRWWALAAALWLVAVLAVAAHQWRFWHGQRLDTDVMALLPANEQAPEIGLATRALADSAARAVVVMVGASDAQGALRATTAWRAAMRERGSPLQAGLGLDPAQLDTALAFYRPWRNRLLTQTQRTHLAASSDDALAAEALQGLFQPGAAPRLSAWAADPLGLWAPWWAERAASSRARPRDGELWLAEGGRQWIVLALQTQGPAISLSGEPLLAEALAAAQAAAVAAVPSARVLAAGVPLHAEAAAVGASREVNTIGWGSLAAVMLLVWLAFGSLRPMLLVALSLLVGTAAALSVTALVFQQVHLLTLVFGASLIGVAEDYGIHYFASRQAEPSARPMGLMRRLLPGLALAVATSVVAYLVLGIAPFPGLRQMAVFSATGLVAAFLTAACWFPWLDCGQVPRRRIADAIARSLTAWPRWHATRWGWILLAAIGLLCVTGWWQLRCVDDIRQLQNPPPRLVAEQREMSSLLGLPGVAQFYLVRGADPQQLLEREEALKERLAPLVAQGRLSGYEALSDWVPSIRRQEADRALTERAETAVMRGIVDHLGEAPQREAFDARALTPQAWLADPAFRAGHRLWLGSIAGAQTSVVLLRGVHDSAALPALASAADGLAGVRWVDKVAEVSGLLGRYRVSMSWLLVLGHVATFAALFWRYRRAAWRAWVPTLLATGVTLALLGWMGQPLQLFNVLALVLLLGIGADYGIFLLEHRGEGAAWLAVVLGAASTWLSFGLLGLSQTPALRAFGLTLMFGILAVWLLSPLFRQPAQEPAA
ncbi:MMPL family transporter [Xylophilus sp. GOD-11R]|uniref:MMPL family transporter n=1 Tax=Xylophilus sp. GOD-11R TaxID=3089814 RepID=UPI00298CD4AA|nr:MMPL family transporter [Xylophilus sp. GOD-11R]WPB57080.1 MMPL family transporter [Xylophilus sp. GOD-11R]